MKDDPDLQKKAEARQQHTRDLAACYARLFLGSDDGKRVLADLRAKFGVGRMCFKANEEGRFDYLAAALRDGERRVLSDIEGALMMAAPNGIPPKP